MDKKKRLYRVFTADKYATDLEFILESKFNLLQQDQWYRIYKWLNGLGMCPNADIMDVVRFTPDGKI